MGVTALGRLPWTFDAADVGGALIPAIPFTYLPNIAMGPFGVVVSQDWAPGTYNWTAHDAVEGDQVIITDINGKEIWRSAPATGADFEDQFRAPDSTYAQGFILKQLPHGVLEVNAR
jgi:hypothetical protein